MNRTARLFAFTTLPLLAGASVLSFAARYRQQPAVRPNQPDSTGRITLPVGARVTPAGRSIPLPGDMPLGMIPTPDGKYLLINTGGYHDHTVSVFDMASEKLTQSVDVHKDWGSLALSPQGDEVYVAGGSFSDSKYTANLVKQKVPASVASALSSPVYRLSFKEGQLAVAGGIGVKGMEQGRFAAGVAAGPDGSLFVVNIHADSVTRLAPKTRSVAAQARVGYRPSAVALSRDGKTLAVSNWGDQSVSLLESSTLKETARVRVGSHPNALCYAPDGRLFVTLGGENRVAALRGKEVTETIDVALEPYSLPGSTPAAMALAPDGKTLFVACADNNDVAVVDVSESGHSAVRGFIPTGWYPSAVAVSPDGKKLFIGTGKGLKFRANYPGQAKTQETTDDGRNKYDYIGNSLSGAISVVDLPDEAQLAAYTRQVRENRPPAPETVISQTQVDEAVKGAFPNIKHVLYIIRENRTYDQVFSDIPGGNGEPKLNMYGERVTPNAHALAKRTVLLDNLYCSGEVSEDGHEWCNAAYVTDFKEKAWVNNYSDRGEPEADGRLSESPAGYLWDNCARHGLSYRSYGEFADFKSTPESKPTFSGPKTLDGHSSVAWWELNSKKDARDYDYAEIFIRDLKQAEKTGDWPRFMVMSLGEDHTSGLRAGAFTPFASVAANDVALGKIVEAVSHSRFWKETAIFVIEDDAQDGPDHVDAHRTVGLVLSPYVKKGVVDSTLYTTAGMVRTMELILGLPPMTQHDARAMPMFNSFTATPDLTPYEAIPARINLMARNPKNSKAAQISALLDFSHFDRANPVVLNRLLWEDAHPGIPMPAPVRSGVLLR